MFAVIFRATTAHLDAEYAGTATLMRDLAMEHYGCTGFHSIMEGDREVTISYWPSEEAILAWKQNAEHQAAQQLGRARWYRDYQIDIVEVRRSYEWSAA